ncbi:putative lipoprotein YiaD precursor [Poriferisphaera corsica]|uniref:Putative lipoprotein YiaD n=1 Tax=Poriferisphaera corsica TaxID=2528020 RepID=A0A517YV16_9BACT|nr:OmpA family protein [Poriferisphaera corsica]QDU34054.1 putative lipoprotein YiaD precursor [Poriferisphaera corsica]
MISVWKRTFLTMILAAVTVSMFTGCSVDRLKKERDQLWVENQELRAVEDRLKMENDNLQQLLASKPKIVTETVVVERDPAESSAFNNVAGVDVIRSGNNIAIRIPGDVLFTSGKASLKDKATRTLAQVASIIKSDYSGNMIRVEGYTDKDPIRKSGWKDNLELSAERAMAVQRYLATRGVSASSMYSAGFGANKAQSTKEKSRRVEIVVIND